MFSLTDVADGLLRCEIILLLLVAGLDDWQPFHYWVKKPSHYLLFTDRTYAKQRIIEKHRLLGQSISVERDGKVITIPAEKIPPLKQNHPENKP